MGSVLVVALVVVEVQIYMGAIVASSLGIDVELGTEPKALKRCSQAMSSSVPCLFPYSRAVYKRELCCNQPSKLRKPFWVEESTRTGA